MWLGFIDPEAVVAKARDSDDGYRCRLGMGYLLAARVEEEEERAEAYRQAGTALLRTVDGENRGLATFVLSELERADAPTTMNEDQAVSYAAWRCE